MGVWGCPLLLQAQKGDGNRDPVTGGGRKPRVWRGSHRAHMALGTGSGGESDKGAEEKWGQGRA